MYLNFYNLGKEPFQITPNPEFLFLSTSHREALTAIIYGIEQRKGFIAIIGEVGLGKTTIIRSYLEQADKQALKLICIFNPDVLFRGLLKAIYLELEIVAPETDDLSELVDRLHLFLIDEYKQGHTVVLLIDEVQNLPIETLVSLRMLSNLEKPKDRLIQIVLVGQSEFEETLKLNELRQLNQSIVMRVHITPFSSIESLAYIRYRLSKAGQQDITIFTKSALKHIIRHARGIPRILNILCGNALVTGFGYQEKQITARTVREVIADFEGRQKKINLFKWLLVSLSFAVIISAVVVISQYEDQVLSVVGEIFTSQSREPKITKNETVVVKESPNKIEVPHAVEKEPSKSEEDTSTAAKSAFPVKIVVKKEDTLYNLIQEVYGTINEGLITQVKRQNKRIGKNGKIRIGEILIFPEPENGR
jgi:general secretion pathway protein A